MYKKLLLALLPIALTGCLSSRGGPDETSVLDAAPLTLPPSFELRPPRTSDAGEILEAAQQKDDVAKQAAATILGEKKEMKIEKPQADAWLVKKAGGDLRNTTIREIMALEEFRAKQAAEKEAKKGWFEKNFGKEETPESIEENVVPARKF